MKTVYKYSLAPGYCMISMPVDAKILTVQVQNNEPQLWALVDSEQTESKNRTFLTVGTGHNIFNQALEYIATFQLYNGSLVCHVFEVDNIEP